jgi:YjbE family integral membrane protein
MFDFLGSAEFASQFSAFIQVLLIDLVLAGDNAVAVGLAAAGLQPEQRRRAILWGLAAAVAMRIGFAIITVQLLAIVGLLLAGGLLLLWVCWKMWRELSEQGREMSHEGEEALDDATGGAVSKSAVKGKTFAQAFLQIFIADLSMSLDNVLAVAGAAREHPVILVFGLLLSIVLMGLAASIIARMLHRFRWIGFVGLVIVLWVALSMIWEGHRQVVVDLGRTADYNAVAPSFLDIGPEEAAEHREH